MTDQDKDTVIETEEVVEKNHSKKASHDIFSRIFHTLFLGVIGWFALWIFCFVIVVQIGFLIITGSLNQNLKAFNAEVGDYLSEIIKYLSFQTEAKPFPFKSWNCETKTDTRNGSENNQTA